MREINYSEEFVAGKGFDLGEFPTIEAIQDAMNKSGNVLKVALPNITKEFAEASGIINWTPNNYLGIRNDEYTFVNQDDLDRSAEWEKERGIQPEHDRTGLLDLLKISLEKRKGGTK